MYISINHTYIDVKVLKHTEWWIGLVCFLRNIRQFYIYMYRSRIALLTTILSMRALGRLLLESKKLIYSSTSASLNCGTSWQKWIIHNFFERIEFIHEIYNLYSFDQHFVFTLKTGIFHGWLLRILKSVTIYGRTTLCKSWNTYKEKWNIHIQMIYFCLS